MKKIIVFLSVIFLPLFVFAKDITVEQKSVFASVGHVAENTFSVPTLINVPISFDGGLKQVIVVDENERIIPSIMLGQRKKKDMVLDAKTSLGDASQNIVDGDRETYVEFPFVENQIMNDQMVSAESGYDNEIRVQEREVLSSGENVVDIDIYADREFSTDAFTIYFDEHISAPTHVRVASVDSDDNESVLLPERFYVGDKVIFPEKKSDHFRITLKYAKPLRINEIVFVEKSVPQEVNQFVRFIAAPEMAYSIYYNALERIQIDVGEKPNFFTNEKVQVVELVSTQKNHLYKKADSDEDGVLDSVDNCVDVENPEQIDKNNNEKGDACEDFDRDGVINAMDNCPDVANRLQVDSDRDGIGDSCDEEENRIMEKKPWIPYIALVIVFVIVTALIIKTLKKE